jgi:hypothetical protein
VELEYIILGTSHTVQESGQFESFAVAILDKYEIRLIAEEYPCDTPEYVLSQSDDTSHIFRLTCGPTSGRSMESTGR